MTLAEICQALNQPIEWGQARVKEGLPHTKRGKRREFDPAQVKEWLISRGFVAKGPIVVETMQEVATYFDVSTKTIQNWKAKGMPCGVRHFDLVEIDAWQQALRAETVLPQQSRIDDENRAAGYRAELLRLELEEARGNLIPVEAPARMLEQTVHAIRTHLEQFPDRLLQMLEIDAKHKIEVRRKCQLGVADLLRTIQAQLRQAADELTPETEDGADE